MQQSHANYNPRNIMALSKEEEQRFQTWLYNKMFNPLYRGTLGISGENRPAAENLSSTTEQVRMDINRPSSSNQTNRRLSTGSNVSSLSSGSKNHPRPSCSSNEQNRRLSTGSNEASQSNNNPSSSKEPNRRLSSGSNEVPSSNFAGPSSHSMRRPARSSGSATASQRDPDVVFKLPRNYQSNASFIRLTRLSTRGNAEKEQQQERVSKRKSLTPEDDEEDQDQQLAAKVYYVPPLVRQELQSLRKSEESLRDRLEHLRRSEETTMQEIRDVRKVRLSMLNRIYIKPQQ